MSVLSKKVLIRPAVSHRRRPCMGQSEPGTRLGEAVGGTAAVCCCFSFGLANMVYVAVYKLPANLYQKILRRKRQRRLQSLKERLEEAAAAAHVRRCTCGCCDDIMGAGRVYPLCIDDGVDVAALRRLSEAENDAELLELEKIMWERFRGTGFWRSPSQIERNVIGASASASSASNLQVPL